ncbi:MAG TPA: YbhB/YbcL family Raf kinase inhibitor-like protein, partial [Verrucomicrobiae bacterium]
MMAKTVLAVALLAGLLPAGNAQTTNTTNGASMKIQVTTTAFAEGQPIPARHAYDQQDISPALHWSGVPANAK